jgi:hypothetical protein
MDSATWILSSVSDFVIREGFWLHPLVPAVSEVKPRHTLRAC